ncbi:TetR family transcriptional regulator [Nocardia bovistercoris]|uniref:TetR family transcriptional regulator n=1 Tax=Nocardia bovistercoris TaxID=2785916 RepID=A0A931IBK4_9NOCA|nr:TetR family transcriptional regulator [Nocardia bovistercoris]MBH0778046.1 TetR family transcriptional regulator [Nocardia bovistercoris]
MSDTRVGPRGREAQRLETRKRVLDAAIAEFARTGATDADLGAVAAAAGVARGTFYFHFPTKEHVLLELEAREEARIAEDLARFLSVPRDLATALGATIRLIVEMEQRLGTLLFKDLLAVHFSPTRPLTDEWREHRVIVLVVGIIEHAHAAGEAEIAVDPYHSAVFFLLGLYAVLTTTTGAQPLRDMALDSYLTTVLRSLEPRRSPTDTRRR